MINIDFSNVVNGIKEKMTEYMEQVSIQRKNKQKVTWYLIPVRTKYLYLNQIDETKNQLYKKKYLLYKAKYLALKNKLIS